jgi:hypothetical protein
MTLSTHTVLLDCALLRVSTAYSAARREVFDRLPHVPSLPHQLTRAQRCLLDELERAERDLADLRYGSALL